MEDYLNVYVHALASYRGVDEEDLEGLMKNLIVLSESCPDDTGELMPPSISGLVYNQAEPRKKGDEKRFDLASILCRSNDMILFGDSTKGNTRVRYRNRLSRDEATLKLRIILVEGLFIYFFAKVSSGKRDSTEIEMGTTSFQFCHGPVFELVLPFYEKFDPIRSVLLTVTESHSGQVSDALDVFFLVFEEIFVRSEDKSELRLSVDYFNKDHRKELKPFLHNNPLFFDEPESDIYPDELHVAPALDLALDLALHHESLPLSPAAAGGIPMPSFSGYSRLIRCLIS